MKNGITADDRRDRAHMLKLAEERGAMTADQLIAAGISAASQARNTGWVAEQLRLRGMPVAA
jgi:outer membrane protein OmpA-like peptidoglycan-associated protein